MRIVYSQHVMQQMFKRNISLIHVRHTIFKGEAIRLYPDDKPYPSKLILGFENKLPLHVVVAENLKDDELIVITAYIPGKDIWNDDFKTKR